MSHGIGFMLHENVDEANEAVSNLNSWEIASNHVVEVHKYEEAFDIEIGGKKICDLFNGIYNSSQALRRKGNDM